MFLRKKSWFLAILLAGATILALPCAAKECKRSQKCNDPITIDKVPITIKHSGKYCVTTDLVYRGSENAITILADNVTINFNNHNLQLNNPSAVGIFAEGVSELTILDDLIYAKDVSCDPRSAAIFLVNTEKVRIDNVFTANTFNGLHLEYSRDVFVSHSRFEDHIGSFCIEDDFGNAAAVFANGSQDVTFETCTVSGLSADPFNAAYGFAFGLCAPCSNFHVRDCKFNHGDLSLIAGSIEGLVFENCEVESDPCAHYALLSFGGIYGEDCITTKDVIIRNSTFVSRVDIPELYGLDINETEGCLVENCLIDIAASFGSELKDGRGISIANSNNVTVRNCTIQGPSSYSVRVTGNERPSTSCVIDNCQISQSLDTNVYLDYALDTVVKNCSITNAGTGLISLASEIGSGGNGIVIGDYSCNTALVSNIVSGNPGSGIIDCGGESSHLYGNQVFSNGCFGIFVEPGTQTYFNTSCNNDIDCVGVYPIQCVGENPAVAGSNICCQCEPPSENN